MTQTQAGESDGACAECGVLRGEGGVVAYGTHRGKRKTNEDALVLDSALGLYAVLDGLGGAKAGEVAAKLGGDVMTAFLRPRRGRSAVTPLELLELAIKEASGAIYAASRVRPHHEGMGTTVVAALVVEPTLVVIGHVGDSRAYLLRGGTMDPLTRDHSLVRWLVDEGAMTEAQAAASRLRHELTRALGIELDVAVDMREQAIRPGDRMLLCSDGLHGAVPSEEIQRVLASPWPDGIAQQLIDLALDSGGEDNVSCIVLCA